MSSSQIYEQHYRRLDASIPLRNQRWIPIFREGLKALVSFRAYLALIAIASLPMLIRLVQIYFTTRFTEARRILPVDDKVFFDFLSQQVPWLLLMSAYAGAGLIANDMRTGGLLLYLSRPLTIGDYILGKISIVFASLSMVTLVPGLVLFLGARALAPDVLGDASHLLLIPKIIAYALVMILPATGLVLVMSALARNARFAGLGFFFVFVGSTVAAAIASAPWRSLRQTTPHRSSLRGDSASARLAAPWMVRIVMRCRWRVWMREKGVGWAGDLQNCSDLSHFGVSDYRIICIMGNIRQARIEHAPFD